MNKMQITHQEARKLIQFASDGEINIHQKQLLESHIASCRECKKYATSIKSMESILRPLLQRQWNRQPVPLPMTVLISRAYTKTSGSMILATRKVAIVVMFVVFMFSAWQFTLSRTITADSDLASVPPIPVPSTSTLLVSTTTQTQTCEEIVYVVHQNDTSDALAARFMISKEELLRANHLKTDRLQAGLKMIIPVCNYTPTANVLTTTFTPILSPITSTPGG